MTETTSVGRGPLERGTRDVDAIAAEARQIIRDITALLAASEHDEARTRMAPLLRFFGRPGWDSLQEEIADHVKDEDRSAGGTVLREFASEIRRLKIDKLL